MGTNQRNRKAYPAKFSCRRSITRLKAVKPLSGPRSAMRWQLTAKVAHKTMSRMVARLSAMSVRVASGGIRSTP